MALPTTDPDGVTRIDIATFILVDDDEDDRLLLRMALTHVAVSLPVVELENGLQLIDYLQQEVNDQADTHALCLVIMDINMPLLSGPEALQQMRQHPLWQSVPVLMMSTTNDPIVIRQLLASGAVGFLTKPATYTDLIDQIRTSLKPWIDDCAAEKLDD